MHTDIVKQLIANLLPEDMETYSERAAILEFDGGLSREEAESEADERKRRRAAGQHLVQEWVFAEDVVALRKYAEKLRAKRIRGEHH